MMQQARCGGWRSVGLPLALLVMQPSLGNAQETQVFGPAGDWPNPEQVVVQEQDLLFRDPPTQNFNNLSFHFLGRLDEGTLYTLSVFRWDYAFWKGWGLFLLVQEPGGASYVFEKRLPAKAVFLAENRLELRFGIGSITGADGRYHIRLDLPDLSCDLFVQPILPPWQPGDGYAYLTPNHDAYLRTGVHSPWATTSGMLVLRGRVISGTGQCYGDRTRFSLPLAKMNRSLISFRGFSPAEVPQEDRWYLNVLYWRTHESYGSVPIAALILAHGRQWVFATPAFSVVPTEMQSEGGSLPAWPRVLRLLAGHEGYTLSGEFVTTEMVHVTDVLQRLPALFRPIISVFLKTPVVFRLSGTFRGTVTLPDGRTHNLRLFGQGEYDTLH
jgi:hypothetical protein